MWPFQCLSALGYVAKWVPLHFGRPETATVVWCLSWQGLMLHWVAFSVPCLPPMRVLCVNGWALKSKALAVLWDNCSIGEL